VKKVPFVKMGSVVLKNVYLQGVLKVKDVDLKDVNPIHV
jgi:hypothetical protein